MKLLFPITITFLFISSLSFAQNMVFKPDANLIEAEIIGLDTFLVPFKGDSVPEPRFDYFWITNDGQYHFTSDTSKVIHRFDTDKIGGTAEFTTYATIIYSDSEEDEPPKMIIGDVGIGGTSVQPDKVKALPDSGFVRLQKNHLNLVPEDTTVFVLTAKNNLVNTSIPLNTYILFLYDGPLSIINKNLGSNAISANPIKGANTPPIFTEFEAEESFIYYPNSFLESYSGIDLSGISLGESFKKALLYRLDALGPQEERHIFLQMKNDEVHLEAIPTGGVGGTRFVAVLLATDFQGEIDLPSLTQVEEQIASELKINSLIDQPITVTNDDGGTDTIYISDYRPIGISDLYSTVARSHDPNQITLQACECPANSDAAQKIICKVDFENTGAGATEDVSIIVPLPAEIAASTFSQELISLFPDSDALRDDMNITIDEDNNSIQFDFPGLRLEGKMPGEDNYLGRTGHITFTLYTQVGTNIGDIAPVQACIIFDENDPFCTPETSIEMIASQEVHASLAPLALNCGVCIVPKGSTPPIDGIVVLGMPLWLLILILLLIGIAIYFAFFDE